MYVHELNLTNVRQFEKRKFTFRPGFNLLVGENGAGKTTLLRSLLAVLRGTGESRQKPALSDEDIRLKARDLKITATVHEPNGQIFSPKYSKHWGRRGRRNLDGLEI